MAKLTVSHADAPGQRAMSTGGVGSVGRGRRRRQALQRARRPWWRGPIPLVGAVVVVLALVGAFVVMAQQGSSSASAQIGQPASSTIMRAVTSISPSIIAAVGAGTLSNGAPLPNPLRAIPGPSLTTDGKPQVLYIGGEFCPYCAADRWSLVNALSRFGAFSNLRYMRSADDDGDIATLTFSGSGYTSPYVSFVPIENEDRSHQQLQPLNGEQQQLLSTLGGNGYPFVDIAGQYANDAPKSYPGGYDQSVLSGKDWLQIADALGNTHSPITQGVVGNANYVTAAICAVTHDRPASACDTPTIRRIGRQLPKRP